MRHVAAIKCPSHRRNRCGWLALAAVFSCLATALPAIEPSAAAPDDGPSSKTEIFNAMQEVRRKYGSDAVILEGHLLAHAVRSDSVGEAVMSVGGFEDRDGKRFLTFRLETGIIYNDREVSDTGRPARVWSEIVEASLRKFSSITVPADGIVVKVGYAHRAYSDDAEVRAHVRDQPGTPEVAVFYLLLPDIADLVAGRITGQQLIDHASPLVDGTPAQVIAAAPTPSPAAINH